MYSLCTIVIASMDTLVASLSAYGFGISIGISIGIGIGIGIGTGIVLVPLLSCWLPFFLVGVFSFACARELQIRETCLAHWVTTPLRSTRPTRPAAFGRGTTRFTSARVVVVAAAAAVCG